MESAILNLVYTFWRQPLESKDEALVLCLLSFSLAGRFVSPWISLTISSAFQYILKTSLDIYSWTNNYWVLELSNADRKFFWIVEPQPKATLINTIYIYIISIYINIYSIICVSLRKLTNTEVNSM